MSVKVTVNGTDYQVTMQGNEAFLGSKRLGYCYKAVEGWKTSVRHEPACAYPRRWQGLRHLIVMHLADEEEGVSRESRFYEKSQEAFAHWKSLTEKVEAAKTDDSVSVDQYKALLEEEDAALETFGYFQSQHLEEMKREAK